MSKILWVIFTLWNAAVCVIYGVDKQKAVRKKWRISEGVLILLSFLGGAPGALLGMVLWNHKTSKPKFRILVPLAFLLEVIITYILIYYGEMLLNMLY